MRYLLALMLVWTLGIAARPSEPRTFVSGGADDRRATDAYRGWKYSGSLYLLTTPDGANLAATAAVDDFPLLVRLHKDCFDFSQARADGGDLRFSTAAGQPLAYEIDEWDPVGGTAAIWVRIPHIKGNARQELKLHWGKADAISESNPAAVFNAANGYLSVWHMSGPVKDVVGTLPSKDTGTTATPGRIGGARSFAGKQGIFCGDKIPSYPTTGAHSTEMWFRADKPNATLLGWGNEGQGRGCKVALQLRSPPHVHVDSDFADVRSMTTLPLGEWIHVLHTYSRGEGKLYVNGKLDGAATPVLAIKSPARLWLGGWYHNYNFVGALDEVRISRVARSADWARLQYENQKPRQTLVGPLVQMGEAFAVTPAQAVIPEGQSVSFKADAGGAQQVRWLLKQAGRETVVATNQFAYIFDAGRVTGDQSATLQFQAIYGNAIKTRDIPITIKEAIPEPVFTLSAPQHWDGRATIEVLASIANASALQVKGAGPISYHWRTADMAVIKETVPGKLILKRALNSGKLTVTATIDNGGTPTSRSVTIDVKEPASEPWVTRSPGKDEKPQPNQFYARDDHNEGTLYYNGTLPEAADAVFLKLYADEQLIKEETHKLADDRAYAFTLKLKPGLIKYKVEFGSQTGDRAVMRHTVGNLVCGDAYLIQGQSNAVATDFGKDDPAFRSDWIRTYGTMSGNPKAAPLWGKAVHRSRDAEKFQIGYWGMELARQLVEKHQLPICIINGAVGGTRVDQHQRNPADPEDLSTIYGRLLWRVRQAKLTHGIRGILWHQGENDQGADGPTGGYGWETYRAYFLELAAAWKQDYPNIQHYYAFQIWPKSCAMGIQGSDNRLREVQRNLPTAFSNLSVMSTLGIEPPGGCHFPAAGYAEFARLIAPLVERDHYGKQFSTAITPPNLRSAAYVNDRQIMLEFDQPVQCDKTLVGQFYLDGAKGKVVAAASAGNRVTLTLATPSQARQITYLDSSAWSQQTLLRGTNGIAALTFCEVALQPAAGRGR